MTDRNAPDSREIESSGLADAAAGALSAPFIVAAGYGTRSTTVIRQAADGWTSIAERAFDEGGSETAAASLQFDGSSGAA